MGFFSNLTKLAVSPVTLSIDALTIGQVGATRAAFEMIDEAYDGERPIIVRPVIENVVEQRRVVCERPTLQETFEQFRAVERLNDDEIIAEKRWSNGVISRWSAKRVYTGDRSGWAWTYRDPPSDAERFER